MNPQWPRFSIPTRLKTVGLINYKKVEPLIRFELMTYSLRMSRSTN